jgi:SNF2 family DNA or RNA helicase
MLRRTKDQVALDLPPKTVITEHVELEGPQRDLYETIRLMMDKKVRDAIVEKGLARLRIVVLDALLKMRQVCCDPKLVKLASGLCPCEWCKLRGLSGASHSSSEARARPVRGGHCGISG